MATEVVAPSVMEINEVNEVAKDTGVCAPTDAHTHEVNGTPERPENPDIASKDASDAPSADAKEDDVQAPSPSADPATPAPVEDAHAGVKRRIEDASADPEAEAPVDAAGDDHKAAASKTPAAPADGEAGAKTSAQSTESSGKRKRARGRRASGAESQGAEVEVQVENA